MALSHIDSKGQKAVKCSHEASSIRKLAVQDKNSSLVYSRLTKGQPKGPVPSGIISASMRRKPESRWDDLFIETPPPPYFLSNLVEVTCYRPSDKSIARRIVSETLIP